MNAPDSNIHLIVHDNDIHHIQLANTAFMLFLQKKNNTFNFIVMISQWPKIAQSNNLLQVSVLFLSNLTTGFCSSYFVSHPSVWFLLLFIWTASRQAERPEPTAIYWSCITVSSGKLRQFGNNCKAWVSNNVSAVKDLLVYCMDLSIRAVDSTSFHFVSFIVFK